MCICVKIQVCVLEICILTINVFYIIYIYIWYRIDEDINVKSLSNYILYKDYIKIIYKN